MMEDKSFRELFFRKCAERQGFPFEKAARWKDFGDEGQKARDMAGPVDYLTIHREPGKVEGFDPHKSTDPTKGDIIETGAHGKPDGILYGSKYYPEKGPASDWDKFVSSEMPEWANNDGFVFNLKPESRIKYINTEEDYNPFYDMYRANTIPSRGMDQIDWNKVSKDFDAVRIGNEFARTLGHGTRLINMRRNPSNPNGEPDRHVALYDLGQILVLNPNAVADSKLWKRNENLHPSNERIDRDEKYKENMNDYTGPELQGEGDLGKVWGYHVNPGVTDYFSQDMQGGRPLEQPSPAKKKVDTEKKDAGKGAGTGQKKKASSKKKKPTKGDNNTTLDDFDKQPAPVAEESSVPKSPETTPSAPKVTEEQPQKQAPSGFDWSKYKVRLR